MSVTAAQCCEADNCAYEGIWVTRFRIDGKFRLFCGYHAQELQKALADRPAPELQP